MIAIRVNGNNEIGMGHMMRCLAINEEIVQAGLQSAFLVSEESNVEMLSKNRYNYIKVKSISEVSNWIKSNKVKLLLVDSYDVTYEMLEIWNAIVPVMYIDDMNMFPYPVSAILNYNIEASENMYKQCSSHPKLLIGPYFFPARSEFKDCKKKELNRTVKKVLISTGSTDSEHVIEKILTMLDIEGYSEIEFIVIEGLFYESEYKIRLRAMECQSQNITILSWGQNMAQIYSDIDLMIAPGSTMIFEAFTVGTPCISFSFVDNQIPQCKIMEKYNICPYIGDFRTKMSRTIVQEVFQNILLIDERKKLFEKYKKEFDGAGTSRIVEQMEKMYEDNFGE